MTAWLFAIGALTALFCGGEFVMGGEALGVKALLCLSAFGGVGIMVLAIAISRGAIW